MMVPEGAVEWFASRLPATWFEKAPALSVAGGELHVVGVLAPPHGAGGLAPAVRAAAAEGRIARFREDSRSERMAVAEEARQRFGLPVTWGAECDGVRVMFTPGWADDWRPDHLVRV